MVWSVTLPSASEPRVVIGGITIRFGISAGPMRAGVSRIFIIYALDRADLAAVDVDGRAVQPAALRGSQERDQRADVLDLAEPADAELLTVVFAHGVLAAAGALHGLAEAPPQPFGLDAARIDGVDLHAVGFADVGHGLAEGDAGGVHRAADGERRLRLLAADSGDADERALLRFQERPGLAGEPDVGEEFQRKAVGPFGVGQLEEVAALGGAGVVDEDVEPSEFAAHRLDQRLFGAFLAEVEHRDGGLAALGLDRRRDRLKRRLVATGDQEIASL